MTRHPSSSLITLAASSSCTSSDTPNSISAPSLHKGTAALITTLRHISNNTSSSQGKEEKAQNHKTLRTNVP